MRALSLVALVIGLFVVSSGAVTGQGKDKDKDKDPKKDPSGKLPTEVGGKDLDQWVKELADADPSTRQTAVRAIAQFGPGAKKAAAKIASRLYPANETDAMVRADAAAAIAMIGVDKDDKKIYEYTLGALAEALADGQRSVRLQAASTLGRFGPDAKGAVAKLAGTLNDDSSWELRVASARALGSAGRTDKGVADATAMDALVKRLNDRSASVRMEVITALSQVGPAPSEKLAAFEKKAIEERLTGETDKRVRLWVRVMLMFLDEKAMSAANFTALAKGLEDDDAKVRAQAAQALGTLGPKAKGQASALLKTAQDKDPEVQVAAIGALARVGDPACLALFSKILKDDKEDLRVRSTVAQAAGAMGDAGKPLIADLIGLLSNKDPNIALAAIGGLAGFGNLAQSALPDLKKLAADPGTAYDAAIKDAAVKDAAEEVTRTKDTVKSTAEEAIKHINEAKPKK